MTPVMEVMVIVKGISPFLRGRVSTGGGAYFAFGLGDEVSNGSLTIYQLSSDSSLGVENVDEALGTAEATLTQDAGEISSVYLSWGEGLSIETDQYQYPSLYSDSPYSFELVGQGVRALVPEAIVDDQDDTQGVAKAGAENFFYFGGNLISAGQIQIRKSWSVSPLVLVWQD